jgi:hypothetical protein
MILDSDGNTVPDTVEFFLTDAAGLSGVEGSITFTAIGANGTSSPLLVFIYTCNNLAGAPLTNCVEQDGDISIQAATPTPVPPTPTATPTPAATACCLPPTGGSSDGASALPWLLAAAGVAAASAAAWAGIRLLRGRA